MTASPIDAAERGPSRRLVEIVVAVILIALSAIVLYDSYGRGAGWDGGPQNGYFPARVGWLLLAAALFVLVAAVRSTDRATFVTWVQLRQVARVFVPLTLFVLAVEFLGIYVGAFLFMVLFTTTVGSFRPWTVAAASLLVPAVIYWVFELQFRVPLPKGPVEAAFGF